MSSKKKKAPLSSFSVRPGISIRIKLSSRSPAPKENEELHLAMRSVKQIISTHSDDLAGWCEASKIAPGMQPAVEETNKQKKHTHTGFHLANQQKLVPLVGITKLSR